MTSGNAGHRLGGTQAETVDDYTTGVRQFIAWCAQQDRLAVVDRAPVNEFVAWRSG